MTDSTEFNMWQQFQKFSETYFSVLSAALWLYKLTSMLETEKPKRSTPPTCSTSPTSVSVKLIWTLNLKSVMGLFYCWVKLGKTDRLVFLHSIKKSLEKQLLNDFTSSVLSVCLNIYNKCGALYLLCCSGHVDYILNAVVKEVPGVLEVWRGVLNHHQLCGVIDARQRCPFSVPVHLQKREVVCEVHMIDFWKWHGNLILNWMQFTLRHI